MVLKDNLYWGNPDRGGADPGLVYRYRGFLRRFHELEFHDGRISQYQSGFVHSVHPACARVENSGVVGIRPLLIAGFRDALAARKGIWTEASRKKLSGVTEQL